MNERDNERVVFSPKDRQIIYLESIKKSLACSWRELSYLADVHPRTLNGWKNGKHSMPLRATKLLSKKSHLPIPAGTTTFNWISHLSSIGKIGGKANIKKYGHVGGNEYLRKKKWQEWWSRKGCKQMRNIIGVEKSFIQPKLSAKLAEFIGIMIGDGGISDYQITVTLHRIDDKLYRIFVKNMMHKLFHIQPSVNQHARCLADSLVISRKALSDYLVAQLGLVKGNKIYQQIDVPSWIKKEPRYF